MSSSRHVRISKTTAMPSRTYHITKHHYEPIRYEPGVDVIYRPSVEHKVITGGGLDCLSQNQTSSRGPKARHAVTIHRTGAANQGFAPPSTSSRHVTRIVTAGGGFDQPPMVEQFSSSGGPQYYSSGPQYYSSGNQHSSSSSGNQHSSSTEQPESFVNLQKSMESELDVRRNNWESEVEKMQHNFFDMKTSDVSKDKQGDFKSRVGAGGTSGTEILTVGDSHNLYHELPDGSRVYRQKFDLHGFDTEDLSVRAEEGKLIITASREEDMGGASSTRQFNRTVDIPDSVDTDNISSFIGDDGILVIEAPIDASKLRDDDEHVVTRREESSEIEQEPDFDGFRSRFSPPEYSSVVETSNSRSGGFGGVETSNSRSGGSGSQFTKTRYLGPDVEDTPYGRKLKTTLYIGKKYRPEDITVRLYDNKINVDAKTEEVIGGRTSRRQFARDVDIPGPVERPTFRAVIGDDGRLYLGGSFEGNEDHEGVAGSVENDMPEHGKSVNIMF